MTTETTKNAMMQAHKALAAILDTKLGQMPEWTAFRDLDRELLTLAAENPKPTPPVRTTFKKRQWNGELSYMSLAERALNETGKPITTSGMFDYISKHRHLADTVAQRIVIQSSLSKDKRFRNVPWEGRRAWWFTDKEVPK